MSLRTLVGSNDFTVKRTKINIYMARQKYLLILQELVGSVSKQHTVDFVIYSLPRNYFKKRRKRNRHKL